MVRFTDKGFVIEYEAAYPAEEWSGLMGEIAYVFSIINAGNMPKDGLWRLANLMNAMRPAPDEGNKMQVN